MDTDGVPHEDDDMRVVDVVLGADKKADSSSEDSDSDQDMEDADVPDPVADIRRLFEGDGTGGGGAGYAGAESEASTGQQVLCG
jgi:hypothetical protein